MQPGAALAWLQFYCCTAVRIDIDPDCSKILTMHPSNVLFQDDLIPVALPACDHYAGSEKLMRKSMVLQQESMAATNVLFDITFDCEDGVALGNETAHAALVTELIDSSDNHFNRIGARVHAPDSEFFAQDIQTICSSRKLAYLMIPKVRHVADLQAAIKAIALQRDFSGLPALPIHVLIETHGALAEVRQIAALKQVECLSFGIMDFVSAHYGAIPGAAMRSPAQFTHPLVMRAKLEISAACQLYGKVASHNVTTEFKDTAIVASDAQRAYNECGYSRMWSIHPDQIKPIIKAFTPRSSEMQEAVSILTAAKDAAWGPIQIHGRLHDRASYRYYWMILKRAKTNGLTLTEAALELI
ncbi:citrate lyase subunit beta/citryl-CoA lyase [Oxalobacteraceae bacterium GrIS 2.11]